MRRPFTPGTVSVSLSAATRNHAITARRSDEPRSTYAALRTQLTQGKEVRASYMTEHVCVFVCSLGGV